MLFVPFVWCDSCCRLWKSSDTRKVVDRWFSVESGSISDFHHSKAPGTLHSCNTSTTPFTPSSSATCSLNPTHSFHTFNSCAYKSITQGSQLLPQQSPAGGFIGLVGDEAAASRAFSRIGAGRALRSFVRVGEWDFNVEVEIVGAGGGIVILDCDILLWRQKRFKMVMGYN